MLALGCARAEFGRDSAALHYGDRARTAAAHGYGSEALPFVRPAPQPWPLAEHPKGSSEIDSDVGFIQAAPPTPELTLPADVIELCEHTLGLFERAAGGSVEAPMREQLERECGLLMRTQKVLRTSEQWQALSGCLRGATREAEVEACSVTHRSPLDDVEGEGPELLACQHVVAVTLLEELGPDAPLDQAELEQFRPVVQDCIDGMLEREKPSLDPLTYQALVDCILAGNSSAAIEAC